MGGEGPRGLAPYVRARDEPEPGDAEAPYVACYRASAPAVGPDGRWAVAVWAEDWQGGTLWLRLPCRTLAGYATREAAAQAGADECAAAVAATRAAGAPAVADLPPRGA